MAPIISPDLYIGIDIVDNIRNTTQPGLVQDGLIHNWPAVFQTSHGRACVIGQQVNIGNFLSNGRHKKRGKRPNILE